jgi:type I restriction-modification system DNA methylase subunit
VSSENDVDFKDKLWKATDILRDAVSPERYASYVLPLLSFRRLSGVYAGKYQDLLKMYGDERIAKAYLDLFTYQASSTSLVVARYSQNRSTLEE